MISKSAVILCGGKSTRMGRDKAMLPFVGELMLHRMVRIVSEVVAPAHIICVAAAGQELPPLPSEVQIARDREQGRGPLEGLAVGISKIKNSADAVYATSCDVPLLKPAFIQHMFDQLKEHEIAVPREGNFHHPLATVYRTSVLPKIEKLLTEDRLRPVFLFDECDTLEVPVKNLCQIDPGLHSLLNCNGPDDYENALKIYHEGTGGSQKSRVES